MKENLKKIMILMIVILTYSLILKTFQPFGIDDYQAMSFYNSPDLSFLEKIKNILAHCFSWNIRIGEFVFYFLGLFPRIVYIIISNCLLLIFLFLCIFYYKGSSFKFKEINYKIILFLYLLVTSIVPTFSTTFIWTAGIFNHLFNLNLILITGIPFLYLINNVNVFNNNKIKLALFYCLSFLSGITIENLTPVFILLMLLILIYQKIKKIKIFRWQIISFILINMGFLLIFVHNSTLNRIDSFGENPSGFSFFHLKVYLPLLAVTLLSFIINKKHLLKPSKNLKILFILLLFSMISIFLLIFSPYKPIRATLFTSFILMSIISLNFEELLKKLNILYLILPVLIFTFSIVVFYQDFNFFNSLRMQNMKFQVYEEKKTIICPLYDKHINTYYNNRLTHVEDLFCDPTYIKKILNIEYNFKLERKKIDRKEL